ncbi:hypothetical protein R6242_02720 [Iodobacter sp. CM08]|uniref:hypothetical protein n=1 Tax=Iodobacter sp. CM08 TaxID=3085902 RepID=UPI002980A6BF|nr:hypothetical protein [Iodobacter sp. CM08]MDW5415482.1 hypothetical protein [Iodobacter sp. CM08]
MKRLLITLSSIALLSACASTPSTQSTPPAPSNKVPSAVNLPNISDNIIVIKDRQAQAIFDDIVQYRKQKGMQLKRRTAQRLEFSMKIPNVTQATEARMSYLLSPLDGGFQLSARVWQITAPGTARENVSEITNAVADKIHEELQTYTHAKATP